MPVYTPWVIPLLHPWGYTSATPVGYTSVTPVGYSLFSDPWVIPFSQTRGLFLLRYTRGLFLLRYTRGLFSLLRPVGYSPFSDPWVIPPDSPVGYSLLIHPWVILPLIHPWVILPLIHPWVIPSWLTWVIPSCSHRVCYSRFTVGGQFLLTQRCTYCSVLIIGAVPGRLIPHNVLKLIIW